LTNSNPTKHGVFFLSEFNYWRVAVKIWSEIYNYDEAKTMTY
jgi:hypothetical protein